jgi:general secretion pathway protein J
VRRRRRRGPFAAALGFTLVEVVIALSIVSVLLLIAFGGLRVAIAAWTKGEDRAEAHQHARTLLTVLARSVGAAYPYRTAAEDSPEPAIQFDGWPDRLSFVTLAPPVPFGAPIAYAAVQIGLDEGEARALVVRQRALPNHNIFSAAAPALRDPEVTSLGFRYLRPGAGWETRWDGAAEDGLPVAVQISVETILGGRPSVLPPVTVSLRTITSPS